MSSLMGNYTRQNVAFTRGEGAYLYDESGKRYLDALCGIAVTGLGHAHPAVAKALTEQAQTLLHTSNIYRIPLQEQLGDKLIAVAGMDKAFFCNSGAEANEAAIKLARLYGHTRNIEVPVIVVMEGAFHGRTLATLTATANVNAQQGFEPLVHGFVRVAYGDITMLEKLAAERRDIAAVLLEPLLGEGGICIPPAGYLTAVRALCDQHQWLMLLDEIQTGFCRTGKWFAHQHENIVPDVMTLAKAMGNGMPIGALLARGEAAGLFTAGKHGTTFGGNPLACRAALAVIETLESQQLAKQAGRLGARILRNLRESLAGVAGVVEIRGHGMMIGIELDRPCAELVTQAIAAGLLINVTADKVIRLLPPLIYSVEQADELVNILAPLIAHFLQR